MRCCHCLRGPQQPRTMKYEYMKEALRHVNSISSVTFTGGEPSLPSGMRTIEEFMEIARNWHVDVGSFYIATNGKKYRQDFVALVRSLYFFCSDNEVSAVDFSGDPHHDGYSKRLYWELHDLAEYELNGLHIGEKMYSPEGLYTEGRCNWGPRQVSNGELVYRIYDDNLYVSEGELYLNCKGNVILGCDWSYASQDDPANILCRADQLTPELIMEKGENEDES